MSEKEVTVSIEALRYEELLHAEAVLGAIVGAAQNVKYSTEIIDMIEWLKDDPFVTREIRRCKEIEQ